MLKTTLKSLLLFVSIPLLNSLAFGLGTLVHEPYQTTITASQFADYQSSMLFMVTFIAFAIFALEMLHDRWIRNHRTTTLLYVGAMAIVSLSTLEQLAFRPYEHGLTLLCAFTVIGSRLLLTRWFKSEESGEEAVVGVIA